MSTHVPGIRCERWLFANRIQEPQKAVSADPKEGNYPMSYKPRHKVPTAADKASRAVKGAAFGSAVTAAAAASIAAGGTPAFAATSATLTATTAHVYEAGAIAQPQLSEPKVVAGLSTPVANLLRDGYAEVFTYTPPAGTTLSASLADGTALSAAPVTIADGYTLSFAGNALTLTNPANAATLAGPPALPSVIVKATSAQGAVSTATFSATYDSAAPGGPSVTFASADDTVTLSVA